MRIPPKQIAQRMCVSLSLVYQLLRRNLIPAYRIGIRRGKWLAEVEDVDAYMASCKLSDLNPPLAGRQEEKS